jgi:hypothetical protein
VRDVGPVATIIETEEDGLVERHSVPNNVGLFIERFNATTTVAESASFLPCSPAPLIP